MEEWMSQETRDKINKRNETKKKIKLPLRAIE
jgi:hypothetical protein